MIYNLWYLLKKIAHFPIPPFRITLQFGGIAQLRFNHRREDLALRERNEEGHDDERKHGHSHPDEGHHRSPKR